MRWPGSITYNPVGVLGMLTVRVEDVDALGDCFATLDEETGADWEIGTDGEDADEWDCAVRGL